MIRLVRPLCLVLLFSLIAGASADEPPRPGTLIRYVPASTRQYVGSPGIAVLPGGEYVVSHDLFGPGSTRDRTFVYGSTDKGATWSQRAEIVGQWWSTLFEHRGALYLMGTSREYGSCVIRRSVDGGRTWTEPKDADTGLLHGDGRYHCAPVPVLIHKGRIWRAMEDAQGPGPWGHHFRAFMMSAPVDADLLKASNWTSSNRIGRDPTWLDNTFGGWLEGNAVATPEGKIVDVLRVDTPGKPERAAIMTIGDDGKSASFDPTTGFVQMPGGAKKFTIRFDPTTKLYWTLCNPARTERLLAKPASIRNTLALASSPDLKTWTVGPTIIEHPDTRRHGYQYVDWLFDGDDLIAVVRTAHGEGDEAAHNAHDANSMTFHRIVGFRKASTD